jgi:hypothetical protein
LRFTRLKLLNVVRSQSEENWFLGRIHHAAVSHLKVSFMQVTIDSVPYRDVQHIAYTGQRGVMLYNHRSTIEREEARLIRRLLKK